MRHQQLFHLLLLGCVLAPCAVAADLFITFREGAPKDRFTVINTGRCTLTSAVLRLDLTGSAGQLIFDVSPAGAGVEVYQPFEVVAGQMALSDLPTVLDGQTSLSLKIASLAPKQSIAFTIDVDDTVSAMGITVQGAEISGAHARLSHGMSDFSTTFTDQANAVIDMSDCAKSG